MKMEWLEDKEKNGELYTNSYCFAYCLKCFYHDKKVEVWVRQNGILEGYEVRRKTTSEAIFEFRVIKSLNDEQLKKHVKEKYKKVE